MTRPRLEVADIFRRYGEAFRQRYGDSVTALQGCVMTAIERCRTAALGGQVEQQWHSFKIASALALDTAGVAAKQRAIQSLVWGSAGLRFLHFLLGRRERRG